MSIRNVIKRERINVQSECSASAPAAQPGHAARAAGRRAVTPGARLIELAPGRYAVEHTCRCGEVALLEIETDVPPTHQESRS